MTTVLHLPEYSLPNRKQILPLCSMRLAIFPVEEGLPLFVFRGFYRGGAERKIRQYLVDNNFVETVISLSSQFVFRNIYRRKYPRAF
jgi:hypothetical protein